MTHEVKTFYANIWLAGDFSAAVQACREFCQSVPLCVVITPAEYVYVGGAESGICVRMIQYPRFPKPENEIRDTAWKLAAFLRVKLCQHSFSIEFPDFTHWDTLRT